ncbi:unnamed protein product [Adineta ricciae]|uniref:Elongation of very long chain fatty acids protein n=1 Tax=Adineta ricciae TaxID=249248 RepID=A0A814UM60_ADIRI|nr:unnamed protein product [Adineta ricciae]
MDLFGNLPANGDVRVKDWPLMQSVIPTLAITALYFYVYLQSYSSGSMHVHHIGSNIRMDRKSACEVCWLYFMMKIIDLVDTIIFVLRKKDNQITFLHVYHHLTMVFFGWYGTMYVAGGQSLFIVIINSFIHVIMYAYYGLSACGSRIQKYLWWKRYLTQAQITQFVMVLIHSAVNFLTPCNYAKIFDVSFFLYGVSILTLFLNFYLQNSFVCWGLFFMTKINCVMCDEYLFRLFLFLVTLFLLNMSDTSVISHRTHRRRARDDDSCCEQYWCEVISCFLVILLIVSSVLLVYFTNKFTARDRERQRIKNEFKRKHRVTDKVLDLIMKDGLLLKFLAKSQSTITTTFKELFQDIAGTLFNE